MHSSKDSLETLHEIRQLMEKSSRFISLSGLSGVFAGIFALVGSAVALLILQPQRFFYTDYTTVFTRSRGDVILWLFIDAVCVLVASLTVATFLTVRQARRKGQAIWSSTSQRLLVNALIPLVAGGVFCLGMLYHGTIGLIAPSMLIFYGLALLNASKYTLPDIRYLGVCEIGLGLIATFFIGYGVLFWAVGFGVLHIVYGIVLYNKYERK